MNNATEAKKGFLTFIATLAIAVGVFFSIHMAVASLNSTASKRTSDETPQVVGTKPSVFAALVNTDQNKPQRGTPVVLGASDTTTESTTGGVPTTGSNSIFFVMMAGVGLIAFGTYVGVTKSRALAIKIFERRITKD